MSALSPQNEEGRSWGLPPNDQSIWSFPHLPKKKYEAFLEIDPHRNCTDSVNTGCVKSKIWNRLMFYRKSNLINTINFIYSLSQLRYNYVKKKKTKTSFGYNSKLLLNITRFLSQPQNINLEYSKCWVTILVISLATCKQLSFYLKKLSFYLILNGLLTFKPKMFTYYFLVTIKFNWGHPFCHIAEPSWLGIDVKSLMHRGKCITNTFYFFLFYIYMYTCIRHFICIMCRKWNAICH